VKWRHELALSFSSFRLSSCDTELVRFPFGFCCLLHFPSQRALLLAWDCKTILVSSHRSPSSTLIIPWTSLVSTRPRRPRRIRDMDVRERNHRIRNNRGTRDYRSMTRHTWSSSSSGDATPRWSARDRSEPAGSNRPRWYRRGCGSESSKSYDWRGVPQGGRWQETCFYETKRQQKTTKPF
jgi:hypothetical protein